MQNHSDIDLELERAFAQVTALSTQLHEDAIFEAELELRMTLFVAEASGEVITSAPPPWQHAA